MWRSALAIVLAVATVSTLSTYPYQFVALKLRPNETLRQNLALGSRVETTCQSFSSDSRMSYGLRWIGPSGDELSYLAGFDADLNYVGPNDATVDPNTNATLRHELKLIIPVFRTQHSGVYRCHAEYHNGFFYVHHHAWVLLSADPDITWGEFPDEQQLELGAAGVIRCAASFVNVTSDAGRVNVTWFKDDQRYTPDGNRCRTVPDGVRCESVEDGDAGTYVCFAGNVEEHGKIAGRTVAVTVAKSSRAVVPLSVEVSMTRTDNGTIELQCVATGISPPPVFRWLDTAGVRLVNDSRTTVDDERGVLRLHQVAPNYHRAFRCSDGKAVGEIFREVVVLVGSDNRPSIFVVDNEAVFDPASTTGNSISKDSASTGKKTEPITTSTGATTYTTTTEKLVAVSTPTTPQEVLTTTTTTTTTAAPTTATTVSTTIHPTSTTTTTSPASTPTTEQETIPIVTTTATVRSTTGSTVLVTSTQEEKSSAVDSSTETAALEPAASSDTGMIVGFVVFVLVVALVAVDVGLYVTARRGVLVRRCVLLCGPAVAIPAYRKWRSEDRTAASESNPFYDGVGDE